MISLLNPDILFEVTSRLSNQELEKLSHIPIWNIIKSFSEDQLWWRYRTEHLVGRSLSRRRGNWRRAYKSLSSEGITFSLDQDYRSPLVVNILFEIGIDPAPRLGSLLEGYSRHKNPEVFKLLMSDSRINSYVDASWMLSEACLHGAEDLVKLLLEDPRIDLGYKKMCVNNAVEGEHTEVVRLLLTDENIVVTDQLIQSSVERGDLETLKLLLAHPRRSSLVDGGDAIGTAAGNGFMDILRLLLADERLTCEARLSLADGDLYSLYDAVANNHMEVVRLLLAHSEQEVHQEVIKRASKFSSLEMLELLLSSKRVDPTVSNNYSLRMARRYKRYDVEKLLLSRADVREADEER